MDCVLLRGLPYSKPFLWWVSIFVVLSMASKHISHINKFVPIKYNSWHRVLFTLYSQPLSDVISCHSCDYRKYVDDTEISEGAPPSDFTSAQSNIQSCISDILSWMQSNKLKLNTERTEMMHLFCKAFWLIYHANCYLFHVCVCVWCSVWVCVCMSTGVCVWVDGLVGAGWVSVVVFLTDLVW